VEQGTISQRPVTTGLRSTFNHLSRTNGFFSKWRGLLFAIFYSIVFGFFSTFLSAVFFFLPVIGIVLARILTGMLTCNIHAAWTHATIANKSTKPFFQQFLSRSAAKHLMLPTLRYQVSLWLNVAVLQGLLSLAQHFAMTQGPKYWAVPVLTCLAGIISLAWTFMVVLPTYIALTRCEASLLPEDREAVVPFDVTFGGRIAWKELDTRKAYYIQSLSLSGAYKTFDRATYIRVVKVYAKLAAILFAVSTVAFVVFFTEFMIFAKKQ